MEIVGYMEFWNFLIKYRLLEITPLAAAQACKD